jgi:hypothetical protein
MDRMGIGRQALSPPPVMFCYSADPTPAAAFVRMQNENVAGVASRHASRFVGMATVPLQDCALAIKEVRYPFDMGSPDPVGAVAEAGLPAAVREQIEGGTARKFLGL